jgi:hypothetical protein
MGRPGGSQQFMFFVGGVEPLVRRNNLGRIECLDEWMGRFAWAAGQVAATAGEEFSAQSGRVQAEEMVAGVNNGLPEWRDGAGQLGRALAWRFLGFRFVATVLGVFRGFLSFGRALVASQGWAGDQGCGDVMIIEA